MQKIEQFLGDANRYEVDNLLLPKGYCQVDTAQDFSGYGNWIHLDKLKAVSFAEGDLTQMTFDEPGEVRIWLDGLIDLKHVDCGISNREAHMAQAEKLGIADLVA